MSWPFLYVPGDRLSEVELRCARLDGDVVEVGDAYMPADAVETRELRAASLRTYVDDGIAVTHESAAWVHGARDAPPRRHTVQRRSPTRRGAAIDGRVRFRDQELPADAATLIAGVWVTTPARTLADLVRALHSGDDVADEVDALLASRPGIAREAIAALERAGSVHHKRPALVFLRELVARGEEVRTT